MNSQIGIILKSLQMNWKIFKSNKFKVFLNKFNQSTLEFYKQIYILTLPKLKIPHYEYPRT